MAPSPEEDATLSRKSFSQLSQILAAASCPHAQLFPDGLLFALIPVLVLAYMICGYYLILAPGNLYNALVSEDWLKFRSGLMNYALWATGVLSIKVLRGVLRESAGNVMRKRVTVSLHNLYFGSPTQESGYGVAPYYRIAVEQKVDNPDQRIVADARQFSGAFVDILAGGSADSDSGGMIEAAASVVFYSYKTLLRTGWYGVLVAYVWSFLVAIITVTVINRTSPVIFKQERFEADFRYGHTELRRHAEEVAFLRGGDFEKRKLAEMLNRALSNTWVVIFRHFVLNIVQYGFGYYVSIVMYLAIALAVHTNVFAHSGASFSSEMSPGEKAQWISQTGGVFIQLLYSFTMVIQLGTAVSEFVTNTNRVSSLMNELKVSHEESLSDGTSEDSVPLMAQLDLGYATRAVQCDVSEGISVDELCMRPGGTTPIGPVSFHLKNGERVLIDGPSGSGKSSVLRALRGLWTPTSGSIRIPTADNSVMFAPQLPYVPAGMCTLRELVRYPHRCVGSAEETYGVTAALGAVGWTRGGVGHMLDVERDWSKQLSPGEAQLVAIARVLERNPAYAVLDEPTSSLDPESERRVLLALREAGICTLTVGHRESLPGLHDVVVSMTHSEQGG